MRSYCITFYHSFFFFFSSRRRHTRLVSDWSSDVCSSDLVSSARSLMAPARRTAERLAGAINDLAEETLALAHHGSIARAQRVEIEDRLKARSEERRGGKEGRSRWSPYH